MGRPSLKEEKRKEFMPIVARTFVELGYRRSTTAEIARRCGVQENVLYRVWPNKKAMFLAAIDFNYEVTSATWQALLEKADDKTSPAEVILAHEAGHHGDWGLHRLAFAGLNEVDDAEILESLQNLYGRFVKFIIDVVKEHRERMGMKEGEGLDVETVAWSFVGLATAADIGRDLKLLGSKKRSKLMGGVGDVVLNGKV
ncbi:TetR/AcrR family transcriptional regulator [Planctomycetota bacterium]|nr:TetR/AcrR family transcriptional regulator [Planctomycetota bacterium]